MNPSLDPPMLNDILVEAAKIPPGERHTRIRRCVAEGRHDPERLPVCVAPSNQVVHYCPHCWSVIDPHGLTWSWAPAQSVERG